VRDARQIRQSLLRLVIVSVLILFGCGETPVDYPARRMPNGLKTDTAQLSLGHDLFRDKCASCHGKPSEGRSERTVFFNPPAPDFTNPHYLTVDPAYLYWRIEVGKTVEPYRSQGSVMPAWGVHFTEDQTWQIVAYLQSRAH
jgi:mono/diheme cytochrome c family protein